MPTIPRLSTTLPPGTTVEFDGTTYRPGDEFLYDGNACRVLQFISAAVEQLQAQYPDQNWQAGWGAHVEFWSELCQDQQTVDQSSDTLSASHDPPVDQPETTGSDESVQEETPATLGAPDSAIAVDGGEFDPFSGDPTYPDPRSPAEQMRDPSTPQSDEDIADQLRAGGVTENEIPEHIERAWRGDPPAGNPHPFRSDSEETDQVTAADPVNLFTGEYTLRVMDFNIPARGFPFQLVRIYSSGRPYFGPFGFNWDHSYNIYLRELNDGRVAIWTGQLHEDIYELTPAGEFNPPSGVYASLVPEVDVTGTLVRYILTYQGGLSWVFERPPGWTDTERIPLVRIADRVGNTQQCFYNAENRLEQVIDTVGRVIRFHYGECGLLEAITDFAGRTVQYHHAAYVEHLIQVISPATDYAPKGLVTCYEYDEYQTHPALQHNIVRVIDPTGRTVVENEYGVDPSSDDFNRVVRQYYLGNEYRYQYTRLRYVVPIPESINDAYLRTEFISICNPLQVYTFNFRGNLLDERFRLSADGSYRLWAMAYRYNQHGELVEIRQPNGLGMRFTYDENNPDPKSRGNLLEVRRIASPIRPARDRVIWRLTYEPHFQRVKTNTDEAGETTTYVYDYEESPPGQGVGNLIRVEHPSVTMPNGSTQVSRERFDYNNFGQVIEWRSGEGHRFTYEYYNAGFQRGYLQRIVLGAGVEDQVLEFGYDQYGNVRTVTDASGQATEYEYNALNQLIRSRRPAVTGEQGEVVYHYGPDGSLTSQETPRGSYNDSAIADSYILHTFDLNMLSHVRSAINGANTARPRKWQVKRDSEGNLLQMIDPQERVTRMAYDERNLMLRQTLFAGTAKERSIQFRYDRNGNTTRLMDPAGQEFIYRYDAWARLSEIELVGVGTRLRYHYGVRDQIERMETIGVPRPGAAAAILAEMDQEFDERGRLVRRTESTLSREFWYDRDSCVMRIVDERGNAISITCDALGRIRSATDPLGNRVTYTFDRRGNLVTVAEEEVTPSARPETYTTTMVYDERSRLHRLTDPAGNTWQVEYDDRDRLITSISPLRIRHEYEYDLDGLLNLARSFTGNPPRPVEHRWKRELAGRLKVYTDPEGKQTRYDYDIDDRWSQIVFPDGSVHQRIFNTAGQLEHEMTPAGSIIEFNYGPDNTVERVHYVPGPGILGLPDLVYRRDGLGRPVQLTQDGVTLDLEYDRSNRLIRETIAATTTRWRYDDANGIADLVYPDGRVDRYQLDALGRIGTIRLQQLAPMPLTEAGLQAGALLAQYQYIGPERLGKRILGNGCITNYGYDRGRRLSSIEHQEVNGNLLARMDYVYDADGRRRVIRAMPTPGKSALYIYDNASRLIQVVDGIVAPAAPRNATQADADAYLQALGTPASQRTYGFMVNLADARRQRVVTESTSTTTDSYELNDLHQITGLTRTTPLTTSTHALVYDLDGRRQQDNRYIYTYDLLGRLREVRDRAGGNVLLRQGFDPVGRVMVRQMGGGTSESIRYLGSRMLQVEAPTGVPVHQYCWGIQVDELIAQSDGADRWGHQDARLSLLAISNDTGTTIERYSFTPFGEPTIWAADGVTRLSASNVGGTPVFGGYRSLGLDGLFDARARVYDADTGCFLQRDPRGYIGSANLYSYVSHNPVDFIDPTGEVAPIIAAAVIIGALFGAGYSAYDATEHPERYQGHFSWRTLFQTFGGALVGGVSAVAGEAVLALGGMSSLATGGTTLGTTAFGGGTLTIGQSFVLSGTIGATSGLFWRQGFRGLFPEYVDPPSASTMIQDYALSGALGLVFRAVEAVGNPFSRTGRNTLATIYNEARLGIRGLGYRLRGNTEAASRTGDLIAEQRVARLHASELQQVSYQPESLAYRVPGGGQRVVWNPEVDVVTDAAWIQVKMGRVDMAQAQYTAHGTPTGRSVYYLNPGNRFAWRNVQNLLREGVTEVRFLTQELIGTKPFSLPYSGMSGIPAAFLPWSLIINPTGEGLDVLLAHDENFSKGGLGTMK